MAAWMPAKLDEDAVADDEAGREIFAKPEHDGKLEDAVRRAMNDLEQEKSGSGEAGRSQASAS